MIEKGLGERCDREGVGGRGVIEKGLGERCDREGVGGEV